MIIPYKKSKVVKAMQAVLAEYEANVHTCNMDCPLCRLYYHGAPTCQRCPMNIFDIDNDRMGCLQRRCEPLQQEDTIGEKGQIKLQAVKEFYKKSIAKVKAMTVVQINESNAFKIFIEIDNKVAEKYNLPIREKNETNEMMGE
jgi:hypothetical protein